MQHQALFLQLSRTVHQVPVSGVPGLWHYFVHQCRHAQLSPEVKCRRLSSCPSLGGQHCSLGLQASGTWSHRSIAAQQTWDPMTWRCVRPRKEQDLLPVRSRESWNSPVGQYPDTGLWHIFSSGTLSAMWYRNGQPFRNTEGWNAPWGKMVAEKIPLASPELSLHTCSSHACNTQKNDLYKGTCLRRTICAAPSALVEQYASPRLVWSYTESSAQPPPRMKRDWTQPAQAERSYQTTLLAQRRAATAQKQEGNILPYLSLTLLLSL